MRVFILLPPLNSKMLDRLDRVRPLYADGIERQGGMGKYKIEQRGTLMSSHP